MNKNLIMAIKNHDIEIAMKIAQTDEESLNSYDSFGETPIILAVKEFENEILDVCLEHNGALNKKNNNGNTALIMAAYYGNKYAVFRLDVGSSSRSFWYSRKTNSCRC
jgi:ankyrin repeat protein